jgi:hypothetical protein
MSVHIPHLRFRPTPFMAEQIHQIALREGRSQASVMNTLILEAIYARLAQATERQQLELA